MKMTKQHLIPRILIGAMALMMAAATIPAYGNPVSNPGLTELTEPAVSLGLTAGAFLGRQLTLIVIALIGAVVGERHLVMIGGVAMAGMNGHDAIFMGLFGGPQTAAIAGLVFAALGVLTIVLVWRKPDAEPA